MICCYLIGWLSLWLLLFCGAVVGLVVVGLAGVAAVVVALLGYDCCICWCLL